MCKNEKPSVPAAYAGYVTDERELLSCSSGGVASALARAVIEKGGYVAGVAYSEDFSSARYEIAHTVEALARFKGSKYVEVEKGTVYSDVKALLSAGETVLFFGLPCVVAALRSFLKEDYDTLLAVELVCHGPTDARVHREYVTYLQEKYQSPLTAFSVKQKKESWTPTYLYAAFENGNEFCERFYQTEYGYAFRVMAKKRCYTCRFCGETRRGDLVLGDFWGAVETDAFWNAKGVSCILVYSEKGRSWLQAVKDLRLFETTFERIIEKNPSVVRPRTKCPETDRFTRLFAERGLFYAAQHAKPLKARLKAFIKALIK